MNAFDIDQPVTSAMIPAMKSAGIKAVILYTRIATRDIAELLSVNGIDLVLVAEWGGGDKYETYTADQGLHDAETALAEAKSVGMPKGMGIYFCGADFDASAEQISGGITDYLRAVNNKFAESGYEVGVYGNGAVCQAMLDAGLAKKAFCWAGRATNGTQAFMESGRAAIQQYPTTTEFGASVDPDEVNGEGADYWGFRVPAIGSPQQPTQTHDAPPSPVAWFTRELYYTAPMMTGDDVTTAQRLLGNVAVDGIFGRQTQTAVRAFQRLSGIAADGIIGQATASHLSAPK